MSRSAGVELTLSASDVARWAASIVPTATCWVWMGAIGSDGYGRFSVRRPDGTGRVVSPQQVAATLTYGQIPAGATLLHDCDVRVCCRAAPGHVRIATQAENVAQAAARGRLRGPRPGIVDVRGPAAASRAIQSAIRDATADQQQVLAELLASVIAAGDPRAGFVPLFDLPHPAAS